MNGKDTTKKGLKRSRSSDLRTKVLRKLEYRKQTKKTKRKSFLKCFALFFSRTKRMKEKKRKERTKPKKNRKDSRKRSRSGDLRTKVLRKLGQQRKQREKGLSFLHLFPFSNKERTKRKERTKERR